MSEGKWSVGVTYHSGVGVDLCYVDLDSNYYFLILIDYDCDSTFDLYPYYYDYLIGYGFDVDTWMF